MKEKVTKIAFTVSILFLLNTIWPLDEKTGMTSSFAEWREGHLHAGIDLPTGGVGSEVYSVCDGYIKRVRTSPWGYGKALYIEDREGNLFVYAHLSKFREDIEGLIRKKQLDELNYEVNMWLRRGEYTVKEGEVVGISGRSGCKDPHLHFEIRNPSNQPVDPLIRGFSVPDNIPPEIKALRFIPVDDTSTVNGSHVGIIYENPDNIYGVEIKGRVGLEIIVNDMVDVYSGILAPKGIEVYFNDSLVRCEYFDVFSYAHTGDSRFEFNYPFRIRTGRKFRRLYKLSCNRLTFYRGDDVILTQDDRGVLTIRVLDAQGNKREMNVYLSSPVKKERMVNSGVQFEFDRITTLFNGVLLRQEGKLLWIESGKIKKVARSGDSILIWNKNNVNLSLYRSPDGMCSIYPNENSIQNTTLISVRFKSGTPDRWIWEPSIPLTDDIILEVKHPFADISDHSIYEFNGKDWEYCHTWIEGGRLRTTIDHLGIFSIIRDTSPPIIFIGDPEFSNMDTLSVYVFDSLSGIDFYSIKTYFDKKPTVFRYDPQMDKLIFEYPEEVYPGKHSLYISLKDNQGNESSGLWEIYRRE